MTEFRAGNAEAGAATVRWRRMGEGPPLVFLHGFPLSGETWDEVVTAVADRFTCITLDLIGLGGSTSTDPDDYSSPGQARVFRAALSELGVSSYGLVGNDTGGWIARELALIDGARVARLLLTNTEIPFHRPPWIPTYQALAHVPGAGALLRQVLKSRTFRRSPLGFGGCFQDLARLDGGFHARHVAPLLASPARIEGAMQFLRRMKFARLDEFERLHGGLAMPVCFVWGADDPTFPVARARAMAGQFPNVAGFHEVPSGKLFFYEEQPALVAARLAEFFRRP
jgi:pimeloyl-ACP methyl ester carboxylesterase